MAVNPVTFVSQVRDELKRVTYPSRQEVIRLTIIVIVVCVVLSFFLGGLDYIFGRLIELLLKIRKQ